MKLLSKVAISVLVSSSFLSAQSEPHSYNVDPTHTAALWHINHFGFSSPLGKFMNIKGIVKFDPENIKSSTVEVSIPIKDINTGVPKLDEHLIGSDFFDAAKYPNATFVSNTITNINKHQFDLEGSLTIHGVTKPAVLHATFNKMGLNFSEIETIGFSANTTINRSEFNMDKYSPGLGEKIKIDIELEANLVKP